MKAGLCLLLSGWISLLGAAEATSPDKTTIILVVGASGEDEFGNSFSQWAEAWDKAAVKAEAKLIKIGLSALEGTTDHDRLQQALTAEAKETGELWLVFIGHGTFDGKEAKFNLRGPDFSATELGEWLKPIRRPLVVINSASSSGPFINKISAAGRVVITATRSGYEQNYARFGHFLSEAITDPEADLDKDGQTSLLEAFLMASRRVTQFYQIEGRLASEHALIDDNGDGLGTPADWFRGVRAFKKAKDGAALDGLRAHQFHLIRNESERNLPPALRTKRDELELQIGQLREKKEKITEEDYYSRLEPLLLEMARLYESIP